MKFSIILIILLAFAIIWQQTKINSLSTKIEFQRDSLDSYELKKMDDYDRHEIFDSFYNKTIEPEFLYKNDSIFERHRLTFYIGYNVHIIRVDCYTDSIIVLTYKLYKYVNQKNGSLVKIKHQYLAKNIWLEFKNRFKNISNYDLVYTNPMLDCIGFLTWEAQINNKLYRFTAQCGEAEQFTAVCKFLIKQVNDKDLQILFTE